MYKLQELLEEKKMARKSLQGEKERAKEETKILSKTLSSLDKLNLLVQKAKQETQAGISEELSEIVSEALLTVFEEKFEDENDFVSFQLQFGENGECRTAFVDEDKEEFPIIGSRGFGFVDIVSASLRTAFLLFDNTKRPVLIHDEPMRFLSKEYHTYAAEMFESFSANLGIQYIITTNEEGLLKQGKNVFKVQKINKKSIITKEKNHG